jgi:hypothetical protein
VLAATGCAAPLYENAACKGDGELTLTLLQRKQPEVVGQSSEVPVFPPPQGGVFTELDVEIEGVAAGALQAIEVDISTSDPNVHASAALYDDLIPFGCRDDGVTTIDDLPVGFLDGTVLEELDGEDAHLAASAVTEARSASVEYDVVLRVTGYGPIPPPE